MAVDAQNVILSCSAYDNLSYTALRYCLRTVPVSTRTKDTAIHSLGPGMFPLLWSGITSIWQSGSCCYQAPWGAAWSAPMQWPTAPGSPHLSVPVFTSASSCSLAAPSPRMCTLCSLHTTTFFAGLLIGCFVVNAGRVGIPSTTGATLHFRGDSATFDTLSPVPVPYSYFCIIEIT